MGKAIASMRSDADWERTSETSLNKSAHDYRDTHQEAGNGARSRMHREHERKPTNRMLVYANAICAKTAGMPLSAAIDEAVRRNPGEFGRLR